MSQFIRCTTAFVFLLGLAIAQFPMALSVDGPHATSDFGAAVARVGDVDGDGLVDVLVGAPRLSGTGGVAVYSATDGALVRFHPGSLASESYGFSVTGLGDFDGDGQADYAIGAPFGVTASGVSGRVEVRSGSDGSVIVSLDGDVPGDRYGWSVGDAGDVDGDGFADLIVGASHADGPLGPEQGRVYVITGPFGATYRQIEGEAPGDLLGAAVCGIGDRDGDQRDEILIGARWSDGFGPNNVGRAYVYDPFDNLVTWTYEGEIGGDQFGVSVAGGADVNADGTPDYVIGAMQNDFLPNGAPRANVGRAYVYSGSDGSLLHVFYGELAQDHLGAAVALVDDMNGDGCADIALGGLTFPLGPGSGLLRVHSGLDGSLLLRQDGPEDGDFYGYAVSRLGDADGDGIAELAVSVLAGDGSSGVVDVGRVEILRIAGACSYSSSTGLPAGLAANWLTGFFPGEPNRGVLELAGGPPFGSGVAAVSLAPDDVSAGPFDVLIDINPGALLFTASFGFDVNGAFYAGVDLQEPALDGVSLYVQALAAGLTAVASNGIEFRFSR